MIDQSETDEVTLFYDPHRGGFLLEFCRLGFYPRIQLFGGIISARITKDLRVGCVDSIWDHGGLLLNGLYHKPNEPRSSHIIHRKPEMALAGGVTQSDPILVKQTTKDFEMWFGSAPLSLPPTHHDSNTLISVWLAAERVRNPFIDPGSRNYEKPVVLGMRLEFSRLAATYPVKSLSAQTDDING